LNGGCTPSKTLLQSSHHYQDAKSNFAEHGIVITGGVTMDVAKMLDTQNKAVDGLTGGIEYLLKKYGVDYFKGKGTINGPNSVKVTLNAGGSEQPCLEQSHF
jgi:dihydrolipoamide dehydrogenase